MSTETTGTKPTPPNKGIEIKGDEAKGNKKSFYIGLILLLILLNGFFGWQHYKSSKEAEQLTAEKAQLKKEFDVMDAEFKSNLLELDSLSSAYDGLKIASSDEIESLKKEIEGLMKKSAKSKNDLRYLRKQLQKYKDESGKVSEELKAAKERIAELEFANDSLSTDLTVTLEEKNRLLDERIMLDQKIQLGSLLRPESVNATGVRIKGNGSESTTTKAKKSQKLKVCFTVPENDVADAGNKTIFMRLLNPGGSTIAVESQGSGVFTTKDGEQMQYTMKADFEYNNQAQKKCLYWSAGTTQFSSGEYTAMFYQDGKLMKQHVFVLN
ncbi:MAG: hypothetical protein OEZ01_13440 [Candidatus Heimdallarchaeota archaeon]|nr:hypothetical protein [Candidatus Heimdallarchaeota archaeon]